MFKNIYSFVLNFLSGGRIARLETTVSELVNLRDADCEENVYLEIQLKQMRKKLAEAKSLRAYLSREVTQDEINRFRNEVESFSGGNGGYYELFELEILNTYREIVSCVQGNSERILSSLDSDFDLSDAAFEAASKNVEVFLKEINREEDEEYMAHNYHDPEDDERYWKEVEAHFCDESLNAA